MEKAEVKKVIYLFLALLKHRLSMNICLGYCAADSSTAREFKSLIRSFPSYELMILISDNTNYNQKMYLVLTASKALCTQYLPSKN